MDKGKEEEKEEVEIERQEDSGREDGGVDRDREKGVALERGLSPSPLDPRNDLPQSSLRLSEPRGTPLFD